MQGLHRYRIRQYEFILILIVQEDMPSNKLAILAHAVITEPCGAFDPSSPPRAIHYFLLIIIFFFFFLYTCYYSPTSRALIIFLLPLYLLH